MEDEEDGGEHTNALYYEHLWTKKTKDKTTPKKAKVKVYVGYVGECRQNRRVWAFGSKKSLPIGKVCDLSYIPLHSPVRTHLQKRRIILSKRRMPIKSASYARYYAKNRDAIVERMRAYYDPEKKREYYEANKDAVKAQMAERYRRQKAERNRLALTNALPSLTGELREKVENLLTGGGYTDLNKHFLNFVAKQIA